MIKTCVLCGKTFESAKGHPHQKFCSKVCELKARRDREARKRHFAEEWRKWRHDFKAGKIASNLKEVES